MKRFQISFYSLVKICIVLCFTCSSLYAQLLKVDDRNKPSSVQDYPAGSGFGHMVAGDKWFSFQSGNISSQYSNASNMPTIGARQLVIPGNISNLWNIATGNYPNAFDWTLWYNLTCGVVVWDSDSTFCPDTILGNRNHAYVAGQEEKSGQKHNKYVVAAYSKRLDGANANIELISQNEPNRRPTTRDYVKEAYFADGNRRNHLVYEAGWPTNVGLDVKMRYHQFAAPNWNNFNDFILLEVSFKNTGNVDVDMNGTFEKINHKIEGLAMIHGATPAVSTGIGLAGTRAINTNATVPQRMGGHIMDEDPDGAPWDFSYICAGQTELNSVKQDFGFAANSALKDYTDIYSGFTFIAVKKGGLPADPNMSTGPNQDKYNIWGIHSIGQGKQRGWFHTSQTGKGIGSVAVGAQLDQMWRHSIAAFVTNGGYDNDETKLDFRPNNAVFDTTRNSNPFDYKNWVVRTTDPSQIQKPTGSKSSYVPDRVSMEAGFTNLVNEQGMEDVDKPYPNGWGKHTKGYVSNFNFDGHIYTSAGPVSLDVGEEVTIVFVYAGGYRLEGIQKAFRAARYAYENNFVIPTPPPLPDVKIANTLDQSLKLEWDNVAENDPQFAGYKIWKSSNFRKYKWLDDGMRLIDKYQEQMDINEDKSKFRKPINPKFNAFDDVARASTKGEYAGNLWGTWELQKVIPKNELNNYRNATTSGYTYAYEDEGVILGFTYSYYVSAYSEGTFTGPGGETTNRIETHSTNRNGASGLWEGTYPYSLYNPYFPNSNNVQGIKNIGAAITVSSPPKTNEELNSGVFKIGVRPNPYKRAALHDDYANVYNHKMLFYNLPTKCKITILDVAGKIIQVINFESNDPTQGTVFWDMFSKDGMEVASGLYVYHVQWDGGNHIGKFAILR